MRISVIALQDRRIAPDVNLIKATENRETMNYNQKRRNPMRMKHSLMSQASLRYWCTVFFVVLSYNVIADTILPEQKSVVLTPSRHGEDSFSCKDIVLSHDDHLCLMVNEFPFAVGRTNTPHFQFSLRKTNPDKTEIIYTVPFDPDRK